MNNLVFINTNRAWGGGEKWHFETALAFKNRGYKVSVICYPNSPLEDKCRIHSINNFHLRTNNLSFINPLTLFTLLKRLRNIHAEAVITNLPIDTKLTAIIKSFSNIKKFIYRRGMPHPIKNSILNKFVFSKVDVIIANSKTIANSLSENVPKLAQKTIVLYNSVSIKDNHDKMKFTSKIVLGNLARLVPQKRQLDLIKVAQFLKTNLIDFEILIAGEGPLRETLEFEIKNSNLENEIKLLGHTPSDDFFNRINLFIFPSEFEGSSNAILEALSHGIPTIAYNVSSMPELVENNKTGFLVEPFNEIELAEKVTYLIRNPSLIKEFSSNARIVANKQYNPSEKINEMETIIHAK